MQSLVVLQAILSFTVMKWNLWHLKKIISFCQKFYIFRFIKTAVGWIFLGGGIVVVPLQY